MALRRTFEELKLELLLQVAERLVDVFVPSVHEPGSPDIGCLELVEVPPEHFTNLVFLCYYLIYRD